MAARSSCRIGCVAETNGAQAVGLLTAVAARDRREPGLAMLATCFVASLLYLALCMDRTVGVYDEGITLFDAVRVLHGEVPHRDFYSLYGPGQIYILAGLYKVFGVSVLVERVWDTLVRAACVTLLLHLVGRSAPRGIALLGAFASLAALAAFRSYGYPLFPALMTSLGGLALLLSPPVSPASATRLAAAGACAGATWLFRYDIGIAVAGAMLALLAARAWLSPGDASRLRTFRRSALWFVLGLAIVVMPVVVVFAALGVFPDLIFDVVTYPAQSYVRFRALPFPRPWSDWRYPWSLEVYVPVIAAAAAVPGLVAALVQRARREATDPGVTMTVLGLLALTLLFFAKGWVRVSPIHMAGAEVTSLALIGVLARPIEGGSLANRAMVLVTVTVMSAFTVSWMSEVLGQAGQNIVWATANETPTAPGVGSCHVPARIARIACFRVSSSDAETALYVQEHTPADAGVFVGLSRHDVIFINDMLLYFIMDRHPVTKWAHFDPGLQTTAPTQLEMIDELRRAKPALVVLRANPIDWGEPNESVVSSGVTLLDDYLKSAYQPIVQFGANEILRSRSPL
jgi:hypothetical protein